MSDKFQEFTPNKVAALFESLEKGISTIAEDTSALREDMTEVKGRLSTLESDVRELKDAVRVAIPSHEKRISKLEKIRS